MIKDYHTVCFKSFFGGVSLRVSGLYGYACEGQDTQARTIKTDALALGAEKLRFWTDVSLILTIRWSIGTFLI